MHYEVFDLRDEDSMVSGVLRRVQSALEIGESTVEDRRAVLGAVEAGTGGIYHGLVSRGAGIVLRNRVLIFGEYVNAKTLLCAQMRVSASALVDANQYQARVQ